MFIDLLRTRRSIRKFKDTAVGQDKVDALIEAVLRAPSSRSLNPCEFVVINDSALIEKLSRAKAHGSVFMKSAPLAIVVCADPDRSDVWIEDSAIAALTLHLAAADLGLGSCWVQIRQREHDENRSAEDYVSSLLGIKAGMAVEAIIAIGHAAEEKAGHPASALLQEKVSRDYFR